METVNRIPSLHERTAARTAETLHDWTAAALHGSTALQLTLVAAV